MDKNVESVLWQFSACWQSSCENMRTVNNMRLAYIITFHIRMSVVSACGLWLFPKAWDAREAKQLGLSQKGLSFGLMHASAQQSWHQTSCCKVLSRACRPLIKKEEKTYQFPSQQAKGTSPASLSRHRLPLDLIELHVTEISSPGDTLVVFVGGALDRGLQPPPACRFLKFGNGASCTGPNSSSSSSSDSFPKKHTWVQKG